MSRLWKNIKDKKAGFGRGNSFYVLGKSRPDLPEEVRDELSFP